MNILGIGIGEGGGKIAMSATEFGINIGAINTNQQDLDALKTIIASKKLLLTISSGGSGKDPNFVKESLKNPELKEEITKFIANLINTTPMYSLCSRCGEKNKIKDTEAIGDSHTCSECKEKFGITEIFKEEQVKHNYIFLFVCLGGGSGSGLISDVVDICYNKFNLPIGVIASIPDDGEDTTTKVNAISIFKELYNTYAINGIISPLILIDNQKMFEMYNLPVGTQFSTINRSITRSIDKFNGFSNKVSEYMSTIDSMDTARLWSLGGCCTIGKFIIGQSKLEQNLKDISVAHPLDLNAINDAIVNCTFVDGFDLSSAKGVGVIAVAPEHFLQDENISKAIRHVFGQVKTIIGDGLIFRGQYNDSTIDCLEFYLFFNGLKYPEERFARLWKDVKEGKVISQNKRDRIEEVPYDVKVESGSYGQNFERLKNMSLGKEEQYVEPNRAVLKKQCNNCFVDPVTKKSMGIFKKGGPVPFDGKVCPICGGSGKMKANG